MVMARKKPAKDRDPWISLLEASRVLGESRLAVLTRSVKGEVEAQHIAGRTLVSRASVERLKARKASAA